MQIPLSKILPILDTSRYKLHFALRNEHNHPLDVFVRGRDEWIEWNRYRGGRDDFSRQYVFSLIDFYPESNIWLFGGIFEVLFRGHLKYTVELTTSSQELMGRLKVHLKKTRLRNTVSLENYYSGIEVSEILGECYSRERSIGKKCS